MGINQRIDTRNDMKVINSSIIYENPLPQLRSRHSFFPNITELNDGRLAAAFVIGEAFESIDSNMVSPLEKKVDDVFE